MKNNKTIEQNIIRFIKKKELVVPDQKILIGLSGGADSIFALHFFYKYKGKLRLNIAAVHVNHNLRGDEGERDEKFCRDVCQKLEVEFYLANVEVNDFAKKNKNSIEEAARLLRYKEFEKFAKKSNSDLIVTAHNSSDNTETVLLNIVNGSGIKGISGIPVKRENIIRPFLIISKNEILDYLKNNKIKYVTDSSNENVNFKRNYLRNEVIPSLRTNINPSIDSVVFNSSQILREQSNAIDFFIGKLSEQIVINEYDRVSIRLSKLDNLPDSIISELFKTILKKNFEIEYNFKQIEKIKSILSLQVGSFVELGKNVITFRERDKIIILKDEQIFIDEIPIKIGKNVKVGKKSLKTEIVKKIPDKFKNDKSEEYISGDLVKNELKLRPWKIGDRIQLLGMKGTKKISDVLTDIKISSYEKKNQLVLVNNNDIIWILGQKISDKYKITSQTKRIIKLCLL